MVDFILVIIIAYLLGSIPTAIIAGKILKKIDIREHGSGNAGATNVFRVLGWKAALVVLLIDMLKGFVPVFWIAALIHGGGDLIYYQLFAAVAAIAGHVWTIFAGFRGGKGVGTAAGAFLGLAPAQVGLALLIFIIVISATKYVSLGSLLASLFFLVLLTIKKFMLSGNVPDILFYLSILVVLVIWYAHRSNIRRLLSGTENKLSFGKAK